jgi:hypothetical protein
MTTRYLRLVLEDGRQHNRDVGHELDENVDGRARRVLERVAGVKKRRKREERFKSSCQRKGKKKVR